MKKEDLKALALLSQVGLLMAIPIFLCVFVGIWLDEKMGTNGLFLVIFILLGVMAAFRNLFVTILRSFDGKGKDKKHGR